MREEVPERAEPRSATGEAQEGVQSHSRGPGGKGCSGDNLARFRNREERDGYMDSLERQMEREQIQHTLDRMAELTDSEYATLRHRLEAAHAAAEEALVEARRRVRLNEGRGP